MKLYEIDARLEELLGMMDPETGELLCDPEQLDELLMAREQKLEGIALYIKGIAAEAAEIKAEEDKLRKRRQSQENHVARLKEYLADRLGGEKLKTARVSMYYRTTQSVELDQTATWEDFDERFIRYREPEINREELGKAMKAGEEIPGAHLKQNTSLIIR